MIHHSFQTLIWCQDDGVEAELDELEMSCIWLVGETLSREKCKEVVGETGAVFPVISSDEEQDSKAESVATPYFLLWQRW